MAHASSTLGMAHVDHVVKVRKASSSPLKVMKKAVTSLLNCHNLSSALSEQLPARANVKMVYACEWNPHASEALGRNLEANGVADRCMVLEGDNRVIAPKGVADRVNLGLLPSSEGSWATAVRALRSNGGMMHVHGNVKDSEEDSWTEQVSKSIKEISISEGKETVHP